MSFNLSVKASANSFTVVMVGTELGDFSEEELSGVLKSGLLGLSRLVGSDSGFTPASVTVEGGVSLDFFGSFLLVVSRVGKEEGTFVVFPFSLRVFSLLFWRGVSLASSFSGLLRGRYRWCFWRCFWRVITFLFRASMSRIIFMCKTTFQTTCRTL